MFFNIVAGVVCLPVIGERRKIHVVDKIWDRKSFRNRRSLAVVAGMQINEQPRRTDKSRTLKKVTLFYISNTDNESLIYVILYVTHEHSGDNNIVS